MSRDPPLTPGSPELTEEQRKQLGTRSLYALLAIIARDKVYRGNIIATTFLAHTVQASGLKNYQQSSTRQLAIKKEMLPFHRKLVPRL